MAQFPKTRDSSHCTHKVAHLKLAGSAMSRLMILSLGIPYQAPAVFDVQAAAQLMLLYWEVSDSSVLNSQYPTLAVSEDQVAAHSMP